MDHKKQEHDEPPRTGYGTFSIGLGLEKRFWLTGRFDLDAIAEMILLMVSYGIRSYIANPDEFLEFAMTSPTQRRKTLRKKGRDTDEETIETFVQQATSGPKTEAPPEIVNLVNFLIEYIANNLPDVLNRGLMLLIDEGLIAKELVKTDGRSPFWANPDDEITCLVNKYRQEVKTRLGLMRRQRKVRYNLSDLLNHYTTVLPLWQDAKDIYKDNRNRNWQKIINTIYPYLPDDLVARLSGNPADLSDETKVKLAEKGGSSEPSDIAVEHAARLCGAPDYCYALSTLEGKKTELNRAAKTL